MPIRTRTTTDFFEKEKAKEDYSAPPEQPVSLGSATKPVNWKRAQRPHRAPLERPAHSLERKKPVAPVVDGSESFLGVFLPRPSVNLTRSSFSDLRAKDVKVTEDFKRPATPRSQRGGTQVSGRASDLFEDGLAPDFEPIELVSVALLFPKASPTRPSTTRDGTSTPTPAPALPATPTRAPASQFDEGASVVTATDVSTSLAPPPTTPSKRKSSGFGLRIPSRLSLRSVSESRPETPLSALPSLPSSRKVDAADDDLDTELLPPQPSFLRESGSPRKRNRASSVGGDTTASGRPSSAISSRFHRPPPPPPAPAPAAEAFVPKMATILTRFSSRQMGDHKCKRGYPIAVFCGAQSMDVGSITNPKIEGAYTLFFGPGHPANVQQAMTDSERRPSHLHNPKPPTTSSTARRAELIAATRALQAIHDLYQGKACAHVCMDSPYVAKAWGSWIPQWEEDGWPGDEHISKRKKDSGYQGSGDFSGSDEVPRKRSSKRLADEDLLRQLAAIRRLYARAERKGTGAAHLYLIDRNSNPASKTARVVLDNCKAQEFASPTQSPTESRRDSFMSSRPSMTIDALGAGRNSRLSMSGSRRSATRESLYDEDGRGSRRSNSRASNGRTRTVSHRPAPPVPVQEEAESDLRDDDVDMVAAPAAAKAPRRVSKKKVAAAAAAPAAVVVAATQRPESIKSAASAVTALSENEDEVVPATKTAAVEPAAVTKAAPALAMPVAPAAEPVSEVKEVKKASPPATADESDEGVVKHDGLLASAAATAAAFVAGMTGSRTPEAKEPEAAVPEEPEAAVPEEAAAPTVDLDGPTATDPVEAAVVEVKDPGVAVPEEPEVVLAPAAVISTPKKTPTKKAKAAPVAAAEDVATPTKTKSVKKSASSARKPKLANAVVDPPSPSRGSPTRGSPTRAKSVEPMPASPAAPAKAALASPAPTPDKSGRLINYSKRNSMMKAKKEADEAAGVAAPAAGTLAVGSALKSTTEEKVEPVQLVDDAAAPLTEVDEEESEAAVPEAPATKAVPVAVASTVADSDIAEPAVPAGYPKPLAAARTTPNGKTVKKQQSMPATRASRDLSSGGDRVSLKSSTSSVGRRFRTLSTSFGRSGNRAGLGASPEEEEAVAAVAADKKARRKTMKWFKKGEDVPPVPVVPVAAAPAAAAEEESEVAAPATESVVPEEEESDVAAAPAPRTNGSAALLRPGHRRQPTEQSVFEDDEDDVSVVPTKANGTAAAAPTTTPVSPAKSSRLSRMSMSRSSAPKSPKPIKTPKPAKEPKAPKPPKAPKEPKEPFSFKRSMGKILTME